MTTSKHTGPASGEDHGRAKLTQKQVEDIRKLARVISIKSKSHALLTMYGQRWDVNPSTLWRAVTGETWAHLPGAIHRKGRVHRKKK